MRKNVLMPNANGTFTYTNRSGHGSGNPPRGNGGTNGSGRGSGSDRRGSGSGSGSGDSGDLPSQGVVGTRDHGSSGRNPSGNTSGSGLGYTPPSSDDITQLLDTNYNLFNGKNGSFDTYGSDILNIFDYIKSMSSGEDAKVNWAQLLLQYVMSEQNYQRNLDASELAYNRSTAANQVALMMAAGMSRAAALQAVQAGGTYTPATADGSVSPYQSNIDAARSARISNILNSIDTASRLANQIAALASTPFDLQAKQLTNRLLTNQGDMLQMQIQGMSDAAMFAQAVANERNTDIAKLPLNEQYKYFQDQSKMQAGSDGFSPSAFYYGNSKEFARAASNPFFWSALTESQRNRNTADASVFEPERAQELVSQLRAGTLYTQNLSFTEKFRQTILGNQAFIDECTVEARKELEMLKINCDKLGLQFDSARAEQFLSMLPMFGQLDFANLDYNIKRIANINDAEVFAKERESLMRGLEYSIGNYLYGSSINSMKQGVLQSMIQDGVPNDDLLKWVKTYLQYNEFGYGSLVSARTDIARTVFSGLTSAAALSFAGFKIVSGLKSAATAASPFVSTATRSLGYAVPIVSTPMMQMQHDALLGSFAGLQP